MMMAMVMCVPMMIAMIMVIVMMNMRVTCHFERHREIVSHANRLRLGGRAGSAVFEKDRSEEDDERSTSPHRWMLDRYVSGRRCQEGSGRWLRTT
jgi:hypothetical protein